MIGSILGMNYRIEDRHKGREIAGGLKCGDSVDRDEPVQLA